MSHLVSCKFINLTFNNRYKIMLPYNIWVEYLKWYNVAYFLKFHTEFPMMLKINFTLFIGSWWCCCPMWCVVAAYGGERYLHQVAVHCASKVMVLCYGSYIQYWVFVSMQFTFYILRRNNKSNKGRFMSNK
jgi:hypothetical protein